MASARHSVPRRVAQPARDASAFAQIFPHPHNARFQFRSELFVGLFRSFRFWWRIDWITKGNPQRIESLERFVPRPSLVEAFNGYGNDRNLQMDGQDGRAFLEGARSAIDGAFALGIENEGHALSQAEGA